MNLTLGNRVTIGFGILIVITLILGIYSFVQLNSIEADTQIVVDEAMFGIAEAGKMESLASINYGRLRQYLMAESDVERVRIEEAIRKNNDLFLELEKAYESTIFNDEDRRLFETVKTAQSAWAAPRDRALTLAREHRNTEAIAVLEQEVMPAFEKYLQAVSTLSDFNRRNGERAGHEIKSAVSAGKPASLWRAQSRS